MARVTIEDCLKNVDNRFELVLVASKRARQLALGNAEPTVPVENDKPTVLALREVAAGNVSAAILSLPDELPKRFNSNYNIEIASGHGYNDSTI